MNSCDAAYLLLSLIRNLIKCWSLRLRKQNSAATATASNIKSPSNSKGVHGELYACLKRAVWVPLPIVISKEQLPELELLIRHFIGRMLRKVWKRHNLLPKSKKKLGRYYRTLTDIIPEASIEEDSQLDGPCVKVVEPFELACDSLENYQTGSTATTGLYISESPEEVPALALYSIEAICLFSTIDNFQCLAPIKEEKQENSTFEIAPSSDLNLTQDQGLLSFMNEDTRQENIQESELGKSQETSSSSSEHEERQEIPPIMRPNLVVKPPAISRRSLTAASDVADWDERVWLNAYRRMSAMVVLPRPPLDALEPITIILESEFLRVLHNVSPLQGFFGVDYDDTWNRAARTIQRLFKKGFFLRMIAKVTRMNRELKRAEEIAQNRKRRRLALKM